MEEQSNKTNQILLEKEDSVYTVVEEMPRFSGCEDKSETERKTCSDQKMLQYFYKNIVYNPIPKDQEIERTIVISFIIEKNGSISNVETKKGKGYTNIKEVLENMPKWKPGTHNGIIRRVRFNMPIRINIK